MTTETEHKPWYLIGWAYGPDYVHDHPYERGGRDDPATWLRHTFTLTAESGEEQTVYCEHDPFGTPPCHALLPNDDDTILIDGIPATPTHIDGIYDTGGRGMGQYAVSFTLYVDAADAEEASDRAMLLRNWFANLDYFRAQPESLSEMSEPDFYWHLHDHDGC
jgi:hypothetical protein